MDEFDNESANIDTTEAGGQESTTPQWWVDEQTAGTGQRPEWLPEKFKSAQDVAKSYTELEKRLGSAPKEYDFSKSNDWLDPDHESIKGFADFAKQKGVPQDVIDKMQESFTDYIEGFDVDYAAEKQKLGEGASERLEVLNNWMQSNLSAETYDTLMDSMDTAEQIMAFEELRKVALNESSSVPNGENEASNPAQSVEELQDELTNNLDKYKTDVGYRNDFTKRMEKAATSSDNQFKDKIF